MHTLEPYWKWRDFYTAEEDEKSPFFGREYSEFEFSDKIYNYFIHPQWDHFGSDTLYLKLIFVDYKHGSAIIEFIGEWNDCIHNDIMFLTEKAVEGYNVNTNAFLSGTFEKNFNRKSSQANWSGLGFGFLVNRSGDYFKGNTAKFFITHNFAGSRISVVPEFYLTDDFRKFLFGVTMRFSF